MPVVLELPVDGGVLSLEAGGVGVGAGIPVAGRAVVPVDWAGVVNKAVN